MPRTPVAADAAEPDDDQDAIDEVQPPPDDADVVARLCWAQGQVRSVEKRGRNTDQKYDYAKAEDVYAMLRPILSRAGLTYMIALLDPPELKETGQETARGLAYQRWWLHVTIVLQNRDDRHEFGWYCVADDYSDKGMAKAITLGLKSWLMATFMVSSGTDDAEATDRQAGTTQREGTSQPSRRHPQEDEARPTNLASKQRQAFAASKALERDVNAEKVVEITRYMGGVDKIKDVPEARLDLLIKAFDAYRTRTPEERVETDERMAGAKKKADRAAEELKASQDAAAEGPVREEPREPDAEDPGADEPPFDPENEGQPARPQPPTVEPGQQAQIGDGS